MSAPAAAPRRRRVRRALSTLLIVAGVLLLADAAATLLWKEPFSAVYTRVQQGRLGSELEALAAAPLPAVEQRAVAAIPDPEDRLAYRARSLARRVAEGDPVARLELPSIGVSEVVVHGTGTGDLQAGPGHYPGTPLPGQRGTVAVAGHRTTYGAPFRRLDDLEPGDRVTMELPYGTFTYRVERLRIVDPSATWVTNRVGHDRLVLTACHPLYSAEQRIVAFARLESSEPAAAAR